MKPIVVLYACGMLAGAGLFAASFIYEAHKEAKSPIPLDYVAYEENGKFLAKGRGVNPEIVPPEEISEAAFRYVDGYQSLAFYLRFIGMGFIVSFGGVLVVRGAIKQMSTESAADQERHPPGK